ncbi:MAG: AAA family ATPase, partial [Actinomycetota bacterium]|nr:AAA family ATPase [Actinomycetota bacterium]
MLSVVAEASTWSPIDLQEAVSGDYTGPQPALLQRSDGKHLMYPGMVHSLAGPPGGGKSWIAQEAAGQMLRSGSNVLYFDFEDFPESVVSRLKILGVPDQTILERFGYVSPSEPLPPDGAEGLDGWIEVVDLVVLDGVTDAMTLHQWNPIDNRDSAEFMQRLIRPLASGVRRPAVLLVDHVTKASDNRGRYAIGAQHKLAAVQVQFTVETTTPFDQDHDGTITMSVTKDRYGQVQRLTSMGGSKEVARFHFKHLVPGNEAMTVYIDPPAGS